MQRSVRSQRMKKGSVEISLGVVVDVVHPTPSRWADDIRQLREVDGLGHVELWIEHIPTAAEVRVLRQALGDMPLTVHGPFVDLSLVTKWAEHGRASLERLQGALRVSRDLGARVFTIHAGKFPVFESHFEALKRFTNRYEVLRASSDGIDVAVENLKAKTSGVSRESIATREDLNTLCTVHPEISLTPDVGHAIQNGEDPASLLGDCQGRIASVHVHDAKRGERSHRCLGQGEANLEAIARALIGAKPRYITLELLNREDAIASLHLITTQLARARAEATKPKSIAA